MGNIHTPTKQLISKESVTPTAYTTDSATHHGTGVDCLGARVAMVDVSSSISAGTSVTWTVDDSPDNSAWTSDVFSAGNEFNVVVPSGATGTQLNSPGHMVMSINLAKRQRYIRTTYVTAGGVTGAVCARVLLVNENYLYDATTGDAISQDNPDIVNA